MTTMPPQPPPGQGPVDPGGAFEPLPPPPPDTQGQPHQPAGQPPTPPGVPPPPPWVPPFPPYGGYQPPRKFTFTRAIFVTLASTIFGLSLLANLYFLAFSTMLETAGTTESTVKEGQADQKVVVLPIEGIIDEGTAAQVDEWFRRVEKDRNVKAVVLAINTPGGGVTASDHIYHLIRQLKQRRAIPVVVSMGALATSGGYYVACAADHIIAQPTTLTGNIGVLMPRFNVSEMTERWGIKERTLTAPADGYKNAGSPFQPEKKEEAEYLQSIIDSAYRRFTGVVRESRRGRLKAPESQVFNGKVFTASEALAAGLLDDDKGYLEDACAWAAARAGLGSPKVVRYHRRPSLMDLLGWRWTGAASAGGGTHVTVTIDRKLLDELSAPQLMYLWRGD